jgi:hypothetical protein
MRMEAPMAEWLAFLPKYPKTDKDSRPEDLKERNGGVRSRKVMMPEELLHRIS